VFQATGYRLGMMLQGVASISVGIIIGFAYSYKFALFILGVMPIILLSSVVQIRLAKGFSGKNNEALEGAGKVSTIFLCTHFQMSAELLMTWWLCRSVPYMKSAPLHNARKTSASEVHYSQEALYQMLDTLHT